MGSRRGGAGMAREAKRSAAAAGTAWVFFMAVCLCSAGTSRGAGLVLGMLALSGVFFHYERVRGRLRGPMLALALVAAADGMSCLYAASGKFALFEYLKVFTAFCLAVLVLALAEGEDAGRRVCGMLEGFAALAGLVSIDLLSTRWVSGAVLGVVGWFTQDYTQLAAVEEGVRMTSVFMSPNVFAGCMGIGVLLSLGLAVTEERAWARSAHVACLAVSSLSFVLAFSMGGCATIVPAFAVLLALTGKGRRTAEKLARHGKAVAWCCAALAALGVVLVAAACTLTGGVELAAGEGLRRSIYPAAGTYRLTWEGEGEVQVVIESQNREQAMMHTSTQLYRGTLDQAEFTAPEDSLVVWLRFTAQTPAQMGRVSYAGAAGEGTVRLGYRLLPGFIANRLQGLRANQNAIQRLVFFEDGLKLFARSPVLGQGLGAFENGVRSVQSFEYDTKYAHNHYIQTLAETGLVGLALFLGLLGISARWIWRGRRQGLAPALGGALAFMAGHAMVEFTFSIYCYLPMAFGVFAAVTLCCGDAAQAPGWLEKRGVKNGIVLGICVLMAVFMVLLGCNITAQNMVAADAGLESLERAAQLDPFEKADHMLSYVVQVTGAEADGTVREKADGYAARLERIESNIIPYYLAAYYLDTGRVEQGLEQAQRYVRYVAASGETWERTFRLLEEYEQDTAQYRAGVAEIAALLEEWNGRNLGRIELDGQAQAFVERMAG